MLTKRRKSSTASASETTDQDIIKQGCLMKSPPYYAMTYKTSWKKRYFILWKTPEGGYKLSYYSDAIKEPKGSIEISDITGIKIGLGDEEKMALIQRMCDYPEPYVLHFEKNRRAYYLVGTNKEDIQDWFKCIYDVWKKVKPTSMEPANNENEEHINYILPNSNFYCHTSQRIKDAIFTGKAECIKERISYPSNHPSSGEIMVDQIERQRSNTEPITSNRTYPFPIETKNTKEDYSISVNTGSIPIRESLSSGIESVDGAIEADTDSDVDIIYDYPRCISLISLEPEENSDSEENIYEHMNSVIPDDNKDDGIDDETKDHPKKPIVRKMRSIKTKGSQLKKTYVIKMIFEQTETELIKLDLTVPKEHLKTFINIQEIGERLCVCKWKGPMEIGCLFYHGDHILAINDVKPGNQELFFYMLDNIISDNVKLTVIRNPKADIFHVEGCTCERHVST